MVFSDRLELLCVQANRARTASQSHSISERLRNGWAARERAFSDALDILQVPYERDDSGYIVRFRILETWKEVRA